MRFIARLLMRSVGGLFGWLISIRRISWIVLTALRIAVAVLVVLAGVARQCSGVALSIHARRARRGQHGAGRYWFATAALAAVWVGCLLLVSAGEGTGFNLSIAAGVIYLAALLAMDWHAELRDTSASEDLEELDSHLQWGNQMWDGTHNETKRSEPNASGTSSESAEA